MQVSGSIRIPFVVNGKDGVGIASVAEEYALHTSATEAPTSGWGTSIQNPTKAQPYLWNRETTTYTDGTTRTVPAHVVAMYSEDGRGIKDITNYYLASDQSSGITNANAYFTESIQTITPEKPYLWNYEKVTYDDDTAYKTPACIIGIYGLSGITFNIPQSVVIPAGTRTATFIIGAYRDGVQLVTDLSQVTVPTSMPTGYSAAKRSASSDGVTCEYTRDSDTRTDVGSAVWGLTLEGVTYNITIGVSGLTSPISIDAYPDSLVFADGATTADHYVHLLNGTTVVAYGSYTPSLGSAPSGTSVALASGTYNSKSGYRIRFTRTSTSTVVDGDFTYTITYNEVSITRTVHVMSPANDGADAVTYELVASTQNLVWYPARGAYSPETITLTFYKITGSTRTAQNAYWDGTVTLYNGTADGNKVSLNSSDAGQTNATSGTSQYVFRPSSCSAVVQALEIIASPTSSMSDSSAKTFSLQATSSCAIRYQNWTDVATGFSFECGAVGDTYIDIVYYNGSCYQCKADHTKSTASAYVPSTSGSAYWTGVNTFKNVATDLLLAQTAKIENLYVDDVYMESSGDKKTALWISPEHEGMKILKMDDDFKSGRENAGNNNWGNPTTWFHGGDVPVAGDIYGGGTTVNVGLPAWSVSVTNSGSADSIGNEVVLSSGSTSLSATKGALATITVASRTMNIGISDGSGGVTSISHSSVNVQLRLYDGDTYYVLAEGTFDGSMSTSARAWNFGCTKQFTPQNSTVKLQWAYTYLALQAGSSLSISFSSVSASSSVGTISYVTSQYVSQFGANGVFIGYKSDSYFRLALDSSAIQHTLLAGGFGLDVTEKGVFQYTGNTGNKFPVGGALLLGYFIVNSGRVTGTIWTFDGQAPTITYLSTGCWRIASPAWGDVLGKTSSNAFCVNVTPVSSSNSIPYMARTYNLYVNDNGNFQVDIATYNDTTLADVSCFVRIDFIGTGTNTLSVTSISAEEAQAEQLEDKQEKEE